MKKTICALVLLATPSVAMAGDDKNPHDKLMMMDENKDGNVSKAEHAKYADMKFDKSDENSDGLLNAAEMETMMKKMHEKMGMHDKHSHHSASDADNTKSTKPGM